MLATMFIGAVALLLAVVIGAFLDTSGETADHAPPATRQTVQSIGSVP